MSLRCDTTSLISGALVCGNRGLGVVGALIPATGDNGPGYIYNDLTLPDDAAKEVMGLILTTPTSGTFFAYEDSSFTLTGAADGAYTFTYRLFADGVQLSPDATAHITVGAVTHFQYTGSAGVLVGGAATATKVNGSNIFNYVGTAGLTLGGSAGVFHITPAIWTSVQLSTGTWTQV